MRVWLLTNVPSPYQVDLLSAIHADGECSLDAGFMRGSYRKQTSLSLSTTSFPFRILAGIGPGFWADAFRLHPRAVIECLRSKYDCHVLSGQYTSLTFVLCAKILSARRKPWLAWLERPWPEDYNPEWSGRLSGKSRLAGAVRRRMLRTLLNKASGILCIGTSAVNAYRALGAPEDKLFLLPYCCDTARFVNPDKSDTERIKLELGLAGKTVFLFSGQLIPRKGVDVLIRAFRKLAEERPDTTLVVLGDGKYRRALESLAGPESKGRIHFVGHQPQSLLPAYFAAADVFVFPSSYDGWGVVINEACAAGLPIVTTSAVGAAEDLVADGRNGFIVDREDPDALYSKMKYFAENPKEARAFGDASRQMIEKFTLENGVSIFCNAVRQSAGQTGR